jgi:hypothetical protein
MKYTQQSFKMHLKESEDDTSAPLASPVQAKKARTDGSYTSGDNETLASFEMEQKNQ